MSSFTARTVGPDPPSEPRRLSPEAFADAFTSCSRLLWCIAAGILGSRDAVEDVLQDGAIVALEKLEQFDPETSFTAWMGRIVRYVALNHARKRQRARTATGDVAALDLVPAAPADSPTGPPTDSRGAIGADRGQFDDEVIAALGGLEETARACVLLRTVLDLPYREIALALDIPEGTAMSHVHRARRSLREHLGARAPASAAPRNGRKDVLS